MGNAVDDVVGVTGHDGVQSEQPGPQTKRAGKRKKAKRRTARGAPQGNSSDGMPVESELVASVAAPEYVPIATEPVATDNIAENSTGVAIAATGQVDSTPSLEEPVVETPAPMSSRDTYKQRRRTMRDEKRSADTHTTHIDNITHFNPIVVPAPVVETSTDIPSNSPVAPESMKIEIGRESGVPNVEAEIPAQELSEEGTESTVKPQLTDKDSDRTTPNPSGPVVGRNRHYRAYKRRSRGRPAHPASLATHGVRGKERQSVHVDRTSTEEPPSLGAPVPVGTVSVVANETTAAEPMDPVELTVAEKALLARALDVTSWTTTLEYEAPPSKSRLPPVTATPAPAFVSGIVPIEASLNNIMVDVPRKADRVPRKTPADGRLVSGVPPAETLTDRLKTMLGVGAYRRPHLGSPGPLSQQWEKLERIREALRDRMGNRMEVIPTQTLIDSTTASTTMSSSTTTTTTTTTTITTTTTAMITHIPRSTEAATTRLSYTILPAPSRLGVNAAPLPVRQAGSHVGIDTSYPVSNPTTAEEITAWLKEVLGVGKAAREVTEALPEHVQMKRLIAIREQWLQRTRPASTMRIPDGQDAAGANAIVPERNITTAPITMTNPESDFDPASLWDDVRHIPYVSWANLVESEQSLNPPSIPHWRFRTGTPTRDSDDTKEEEVHTLIS